MGLKHSPLSEPHILEIGLGTGLNAFLTLLSAEETRRKVHYTGIERYPLAEETLKQLDYPRLIGKQHEEDYYAIHQAPWDTETGECFNPISIKICCDSVSAPFTE